MLTPALKLALNEQLQFELRSAYSYLAMSAWCDSQHFPGAAAWLRRHGQAELGHGLKLYDFLLDRGGELRLDGLPAPAGEFASLLAVFLAYQQAEKAGSLAINKLYELARQEKAFELEPLILWFIQEHVTEEKQVDALVERLRQINGQGGGLLMIDRELASAP
jgi:ferritin